MKRLFYILLVLGLSACDPAKLENATDPNPKAVSAEISKLKISGVLSVANDLSCVTARIAALNATGDEVVTTTELNVVLSEFTQDSSGAMAFYRDSACATLLVDSKVTIAAASTGAAFYYKVSDLMAGMIAYGNREIRGAIETLTVDPLIVNVTPNPADHISFFNINPASGPYPLAQCISVYINATGANGLETALSSTQNTTVSLSTSPANSITLFADSNCTVTGANPILQSGTSWVGPVYFKANSAITITVTATAPSGISGQLVFSSQ